jgi:altronate dehydratase small subunit
VDNRRKAIVITEKDNVATALIPLAPDETVSVVVQGRPEVIKLLSSIPKGHKFALQEIAAGGDVIKYGEPIGQATTRIPCGEHVHVHNVASHTKTRKGVL